MGLSDWLAAWTGCLRGTPLRVWCPALGGVSARARASRHAGLHAVLAHC
jgi:hypothetical protein